MVGGEGGDDVEQNLAVAAADRAGGAADIFLGEEQAGGAGSGQDQGGRYRTYAPLFQLFCDFCC